MWKITTKRRLSGTKASRDLLLLIALLIIASLSACTVAFTSSLSSNTNTRANIPRITTHSIAFVRRNNRCTLHSAGTSDEDIDDREEEQEPPPAPSKIDNILKDIHSQGLPFRVVVIGNGAILEATSILGPYFATSTSPKTGEHLVTLASDDKSFEFHLKIDQVAKVTFTEKDRPMDDGGEKKTTLRICRFINDVGNPICSLILADSSKEASDWFTDMTIRYGYEVQL